VLTRLLVHKVQRLFKNKNDGSKIRELTVLLNDSCYKTIYTQKLGHKDNITKY
jgi:hypothetical protein